MMGVHDGDSDMVGGCALGKPRADLEVRAIGETSGGGQASSPCFPSTQLGNEGCRSQAHCKEAADGAGMCGPGPPPTFQHENPGAGPGLGAASASPAGSASCPLGSSVSASPGPCSPSSFVSLSHSFTSHPQWSSCSLLLVPQN